MPKKNKEEEQEENVLNWNQQIKYQFASLAALLFHEESIRRKIIESIIMAERFAEKIPELPEINFTKLSKGLSRPEREKLFQSLLENKPPTRFEMLTDVYTNQLAILRRRVTPLTRPLVPTFFNMFQFPAVVQAIAENNQQLAINALRSSLQNVSTINPQFVTTLKVTNRVLASTSAILITNTIITSDNKLQTAVHEIAIFMSSLSGGYAVGTLAAGTAPLVCGPGAPVCAVVYTTGATILGGVLGSGMGEYLLSVSRPLGSIINSTKETAQNAIDTIETMITGKQANATKQSTGTTDQPVSYQERQLANLQSFFTTQMVALAQPNGNVGQGMSAEQYLATQSVVRLNTTPTQSTYVSEANPGRFVSQNAFPTYYRHNKPSGYYDGCGDFRCCVISSPRSSGGSNFNSRDYFRRLQDHFFGGTQSSANNHCSDLRCTF